MNNKQITKIVITGGPCAGKTTAMSKIRERFTDLGYVVIFVPETSTELISNGIAPWTLYESSYYQNVLLSLQLEKEKIYEQAAKESKNSDKVLIVCDRGALDSRAYVSEAEFQKLLEKNNLEETLLRDSYDAVFHLVTAAKGAEEFYTLSNNTARTEGIEKAIELDEKTMQAWTGHPHLRIIDNSTNFEDKIKRLIEEISVFLGEPKPYEIERKFLIKYPNLDVLNNSKLFKKSEIIQTYLISTKDEETRIRQSGLNGYFTYTKTTKKKLSGIRRIEIEKRITKDEYLNLLLQIDTSKKQIRKTRYRFVYNNQYFEVDIYPFWKDRAIMEIELKNENQKVQIPDFIEVIKEVTDDDNFKNSSLARQI